ncbi:hypothetical protein [Lacrimispora sp.]|uniref:hypothetical protein n=1 Tax=Lacrimispora sp. TaxID=2719234 RepID=UPI0028A592B1|nr:hypothetical protein [Lacrimispora sp.]
MEKILYAIFIPIILCIITKYVESLFITKSYPKLKVESVDGLFYFYWFIVWFFINLLLAVVTILLYSKLKLLSDEDVFGFHIFMNWYLTTILCFSCKSMKNKIIYRKSIIMKFIAYIFIILPSILINTLFYYKKPGVLLFFIILVMNIAGLLFFNERYDAYICEFINITLNNGTKIKDIKSSDIETNSKWLVIRKKCNKTYLDLKTITRIDYFGEYFRVDHDIFFSKDKLHSFFISKTINNH